jgi:adenine-specific DNA methylase
MKQPRVLIEEWLPAAAIGVECIRERSTGQQPPDKRLHVWWARRPLTVSRAAVLGSLLPAGFPRDVFEKLMGFWGRSEDIVAGQRLLDWAKEAGEKVDNPHGTRAFRQGVGLQHVRAAHAAAGKLWGNGITVIDPMAGGGSIPLECARMGFRALANEYNPVACSVLEATVDYPFRFGDVLGTKARKWGTELRRRFSRRVQPFFPSHGIIPAHCYIFARTVPCPETQHATPLVPDWHLLKPKTGKRIVARPKVDLKRGTWAVDIVEAGRGAGQLREPPAPSYGDGKGISLFTNLQIPADYIKAKAQAGEMGSTLYAVALKTNRGLTFQPPNAADLEALQEAECELKRQRARWERASIIPTELYPQVSSDERPRLYGMPRWADLFSPRQLLCFGVLVEELTKLRAEIIEAEGRELGEAVGHLLAFVLDKFTNYNSLLASWHAPHAVMRSVFDRHDYSFKPTFSEMAPCNSGSGLDWAIDNVLEAHEEIARLCKESESKPVEVTLGSATNLPHVADGSITAVVVDPPYADNVQYSELADFFYVWLKRTQGHRRPEWFSTYLCEHDQEAVVNISRHRDGGRLSAKEAREAAHTFYQKLMTDTFRECRRILRDDGVLTVMFTHKKQEAWVSLFNSLIEAGFRITATWPVKTESEHSLHQARKNAAQSTVLLVARKRAVGTGVGYFNDQMRTEIRAKARATAERLQDEGLNPVDQLVGSFGPAMEVYSRCSEVRLDTGEPVGVAEAIDIAADAVSEWRIERLAARGLSDVEPEGCFALLCWDVLGAGEFRFNEAKLLGNAVGMDVDELVAAGLVSKSGDKILMLSARERRRRQPLEPDEAVETLFGAVPVSKKHKKADVLQVHPNDPHFRTALDACHALALRYTEAGGGKAGIGSAKALARQQGWGPDSRVARLMQALVKAAPKALRKEGPKNSPAAKFPEFCAWHALLDPLFGMEPPDWTELPPPQAGLAFPEPPEEEDQSAEEDEETEE